MPTRRLARRTFLQRMAGKLLPHPPPGKSRPHRQCTVGHRLCWRTGQACSFDTHSRLGCRLPVRLPTVLRGMPHNQLRLSAQWQSNRTHTAGKRRRQAGSKRDQPCNSSRRCGWRHPLGPRIDPWRNQSRRWQWVRARSDRLRRWRRQRSCSPNRTARTWWVGACTGSTW